MNYSFHYYYVYFYYFQIIRNVSRTWCSSPQFSDSSRFLVDDFTSRQPFTSCSEEEFYQLITQSANQLAGNGSLIGAGPLLISLNYDMSLIILIVLGCISLELFNVTSLFRIAPLLMMSLLLPALLCCMLVTQTCAQPPRSAPHCAALCCADGLSVQVHPAPPDSVCSCTAVPGRDEGRKQGMMLLLEIL